MVDDLRDYLVCLTDQMATRDAAEAIGYARSSQASFTDLCGKYGVEPPKRVNQHTSTTLKQEAVRTAYTTRQRHLHKPSRRETVGVERNLVVGDIHAPFQDDKAVELALALAQDLQPEVITFNGDIADCYAVSRFSKDPHRALMLQDELDGTHAILKAFRDVCPDSDMVYIEGNHEARMKAYLISRAPELSGLDALDLRSLLRLDSLGIEYVPSKGRSAYWRYGAVSIGHFDRVSKHSAYTEKALVDDRRESLIQGHTHRGGVYYVTLPNGDVLAGIGGFCLCDTDPEYCTDPNWQQGVVVITKRTATDRFFIQPVPFVDHECLYNDTLYSS